jgi:hypothetical protein
MTMLYFLFTDETNQQPSESSQFFIYGGVFVQAEKLNELHQLVESARRDNGYNPDDEFKFSPSSKPDHVTREQFKQAKHTVLQGCAQLGLKFAACLTLHQIARNRTTQELVGWGANTIIAAFDQFLEEENASGVCIMDRLPFESGFQYLQEKFRVGLRFPNGNTKRLERIHLFASSCEGASHAMSAIDILLGSFRYCVNERHRSIAPREMLPIIVGMMWHRKTGDTYYIRDRGLIFRPKHVQLPEYQQAYDELTKHLINLLSEAG